MRNPPAGGRSCPFVADWHVSQPIRIDLVGCRQQDVFCCSSSQCLSHPSRFEAVSRVHKEHWFTVVGHRLSGCQDCSKTPFLFVCHFLDNFKKYLLFIQMLDPSCEDLSSVVSAGHFKTMSHMLMWCFS